MNLINIIFNKFIKKMGAVCSNCNMKYYFDDENVNNKSIIIDNLPKIKDYFKDNERINVKRKTEKNEKSQYNRIITRVLKEEKIKKSRPRRKTTIRNTLLIQSMVNEVIKEYNSTNGDLEENEKFKD